MRSVKIVALLATVGLVALLVFLWNLGRFGDPLLSAAYAGNANKVARLLAAGANPNKSGSYGNTPLTLAAYANQTKIARMLIDHGASLSITDGSGMTPLHCAAYKGHADVATVLVDHGAPVNVVDRYGCVLLLPELESAAVWVSITPSGG